MQPTSKELERVQLSYFLQNTKNANALTDKCGGFFLLKKSINFIVDKNTKLVAKRKPTELEKQRWLELFEKVRCPDIEINFANPATQLLTQQNPLIFRNYCICYYMDYNINVLGKTWDVSALDLEEWGVFDTGELPLNYRQIVHIYRTKSSNLSLISLCQ